MTSTTQQVEGLEEFGSVRIAGIFEQKRFGQVNETASRLLGNVTVPRDYPGSSNVGTPDNVSTIVAVSYDGGETWGLL
jgi:hypothetical protein